jgi:hypothetical protein
MQRIYFLVPFLAIIGLFLTTGCNVDGLCKRGKGELETRTFDLASIQGLDIEGEARVFLRQGDVQQVEVQSHANVFKALDLRVADGLMIGKLDGCWTNADLTYFITITEPLNQVNVSGSSELIGETLIRAADQLDLDVSGSGDIELDLEASDIFADISGSGKIRLKGTADDQRIRVSGSGDYLAFDLIADDCVATVSGSGKVEVYVTGDLDATVSGSGDVLYRGTPTSVQSNISGSGDVKKG